MITGGNFSFSLVSRAREFPNSHLDLGKPVEEAAKTRSGMTKAIIFFRQNDAGSRASNTYYWENLVLVVVPVLDSKGFYL